MLIRIAYHSRKFCDEVSSEREYIIPLEESLLCGALS